MVLVETSGSTEQRQRAGRREWGGLAVLALPTLLVSLDLSVLFLALPTVLFLALPQLSSDLGASGVQQLWIMDGYGFMIAGFLITMGTLGDRIGRRRLLMIGAACFGLVSLAAAFASSPEMLIAARALMGVAGATLMPSTLALITTMFHDGRQRGLAIAVWMSCFMAGTAIGPLVGGALLRFFWWGSVFLLGVPVMLVLLVVGRFLLPEFRDPAAARVPDLVSLALLLGAILPVIYGMKLLARDGLGTTAVLAVVLGLVVGVVFVVRQRKLVDPLVDMGLFGNRAVTGGLAVLLLGPAAMGGISLFVNQFLQMVRGLSPLKSGLWLLPVALGTVVGTMSAPALARRIRPAFVVAGGLVVASAGTFLLTQVGGMPLLVLGTGLLFLGFGPVAALGNTLVVGSAAPEKAGAAAALAGTSSELGIALGVAVLGSIGTAVYRSQMATVSSAGVSPAAVDAARDSLAGATTAGSALIDPAREAFVDGLNAAAGVTSVALLVIAVLTVALLRRMPATGSQTGG